MKREHRDGMDELSVRGQERIRRIPDVREVGERPGLDESRCERKVVPERVEVPRMPRASEPNVFRSQSHIDEAECRGCQRNCERRSWRPRRLWRRTGGRRRSSLPRSQREGERSEHRCQRPALERRCRPDRLGRKDERAKRDTTSASRAGAPNQQASRRRRRNKPEPAAETPIKVIARAPARKAPAGSASAASRVTGSR